MKELEYFYNNHYRTPDMMLWSQLTAKQKEALENCPEYLSYQLEKAVHSFSLDCLTEVNKLKEVVKRVSKLVH